MCVTADLFAQPLSKTLSGAGAVGTLAMRAVCAGMVGRRLLRHWDQSGP